MGTTTKQTRIEKANARLASSREEVLDGGGKDRVAAQLKRGKLSARERISLLCDDGTFTELDALVVHDCQDFGMAEKKHPQVQMNSKQTTSVTFSQSNLRPIVTAF